METYQIVLLTLAAVIVTLARDQQESVPAQIGIIATSRQLHTGNLSSNRTGPVR